MSYDENRISDLIDGGLQQQQVEFEKIEELLKPRWKCISKYPNALWAIGDIIKNRFTPVFVTDCSEYDIDYYDNLFQPLPWYAERSVDEMPEYVKLVHPDYHYSVQKVVKWNQDGSSLITEDWDQYQSSKVFQPATLEEYQTFKQLKP